MLTHSLTLVNWFGGGGNRGEEVERTRIGCEGGGSGGGGLGRVEKRDISAGFVPQVRML